MMEQLQLHNAVAALRQAMRDAWSTASVYEAHLCSSPSEPEVYEKRLLQQLEGLYVRVVFILEALRLTELLAEFKAGFERFRQERVELALDEFGNPYPLALEYLAMYVSPLGDATSNSSESLDELPRLERILQGTARLLKGRGIEPCKEVEVRNAIYETLIHFYPGTVRDIPIAKVSKCYKPDIGVPSLKAAVEFKFCDTEEELKRAIGGIFEDVAGYAGSDDWTHFYAVFYITDNFMTQAQVEAEFNLSRVDRQWRPLLVPGGGARQRVGAANTADRAGGKKRGRSSA
jgi:hypothetical protein